MAEVTTVDVRKMVDPMLAEDSAGISQALSMMSGTEAKEFYKQECSRCGVKPNNTFLRALSGDVSLINFANSYFGERGMMAVAPTLKKIAVISLNLSNTGLSFEDVGHLHEALGSHPTLNSLDVTGNALSLPSARRLLSLAIQNRRITTISVDETVPKKVLIHKQCLTNANVCVYASACLVCQKSMIHSVVHGVEAHIILRIIERLGPHVQAISSIEFQCLWRCLIAAIDINDNVLFLHSSDCIQTLADEIVVGLHYATSVCTGQATQPKPKLGIVQKCIAEAVERIQAQRLPESSFHPVESNKGDPRESDYKLCTISGVEGLPIGMPHTRALEILAKDLRGMVGSKELRPSAFARLSHLMLRNWDMRPCSPKAIRMLIRFGIHGSGAAQASTPQSDDTLLTSLATKLPLPPDREFTVVDFNSVTVLDQGEQDTACACSVASLMSDIDGIQMDRYFIFATARHLSGRTIGHLGVDLRSVCKAVQTFGCLEQSRSPFHIDSPRHEYADWAAWAHLDNFEVLRKAAFAHRKIEFYQVTGPHETLFDNCRAALYAYRNQGRGIVMTLKWRVHWMNAEKGIIQQERNSGGFLTAVKVVGQTIIDNEVRLIIQPNFGKRVGNRGFFYATRAIINRNSRGVAFMFLNTRSVMEKTGMPLPTPMYRTLVSRNVEDLLQRPTQVLDVIRMLTTRVQRLAAKGESDRLQQLFSSIPPAMLYFFYSSTHPWTEQERRRVEDVRRLYASHSNSQVAFFWHEIGGPAAIDWASSLMERLDAIYSARMAAQKAETNQRLYLHSHRLSKWNEQSSANLIELRSASTATASRSREVTVGEPTDIDFVGDTEDDQDEEIFSLKPKPPTGSKASVASSRKNTVTGAQRQKSVQRAQEDAVVERHRRLLEFNATGLKEEHEHMLQSISLEAIAEKERVERQTTKYHRKTDFTWSPDELDVNGVSSSAMYKLQQFGSKLPVRFIGKDLKLWHFANDDGKHSSRAFAFLDDSVCEYDFTASQCVKELHLIKDEPSLRHFPFSKGFDASVVCTALNRNEAFVFCEEHWIRWDMNRQACTSGPFDIHQHSLFRNLPLRFRERVDCVLDVPGEKTLVFFCGKEYLYYSLDKMDVVGAPHGFESGPLGSMLGDLPGTPVAYAYDWSSRLDDSAAITILSNAGYVVEATIAADDVMVLRERSAMHDTVFGGLPLPFQQASSEAFNALQATLINELPRNKVANVQQYVRPDPPSGVIAPSSLAEGVHKSWKMSITTDFSVRVAPHDIASGIDAIIEPLGEHQLEGILQHDMTKLVQDEENVTRVVTFDNGNLNPTRFGYVQLSLDLSNIDKRRLCDGTTVVAIEVSWDGICYQTVSTLTVLDAFCDAWWPVTHFSRFWRLRCINFKRGMAITKVCWFSLHWVTDSPSYALSEQLKSTGRAQIRIEADLQQPPSQILAEIASGSVFTTAPGTVEHIGKHLCLPLLPPNETCLFFVGDSFCEWDFQRDEVVGSRVLSFSRHPAFRRLPFPFSSGLDAAFYPDPVHSKTVVFISNGLLIEWDLARGEVVRGAKPIVSSFWFRGIPPQALQPSVDAIVNIWERPGHVLVFAGSTVTEWNLHDQSVVEGPMARSQLPIANHADIDESTQLRSAASFPTSPTSMYFFTGSTVASHSWSTDGSIEATDAPVEVSLSPTFAKLSWYLRWGLSATNYNVVIDLGDENAVVTGITMKTQDGVNPNTDWQVLCGHDGADWEAIATHQQSNPRSTTMWDIERCRVGCRFWKLVCLSNDGDQPINYQQLHFHTLPVASYYIPPESVRSNGSSTGMLLGSEEEEGYLTFDRHPSRNNPNHLTCDFGVDAPPELVAFSLVASEAAISDLWAVLYSDDGSAWTEAGSWRVRGQRMKLQWAPAQPHRYWRFELRASLGAPKQVNYQQLQLFEYTGPSFSSLDKGQYLRGLASLFPSLETDTRLEVDCVVGSSLGYDFKGDPQPFVGVGIYTEVDSLTFMTAFEVEYSDDAKQWTSVGEVLVCDDLGTTAWEQEGRHRFWRLRITRHFGGTMLRFQRIEFFVSGPTLYQQHQLLQTNPGENEKVQTFEDASATQGAFIACHAVVPGLTTFVVERATADPRCWCPVGVLHNSVAHKRTLSCGWAPTSSSQRWRLRNITEDFNGATPSNTQSSEFRPPVGAENTPLVVPAATPPAALLDARHAIEEEIAPLTPKSPRINATPEVRLPKIATRVTWSSFTGTRSHPADIGAGAEVTGQGFVTATQDALMTLCSTFGASTPLVSDPAETAQIITWKLQSAVQLTEVEMVCSGGDIVPTPRMLVETSDDGIRFSSVAEATLERPQCFWHAAPSKFWRLHVSTPLEQSISLNQVKWKWRLGCPSLIAAPRSFSLSDAMNASAMAASDAGAPIRKVMSTAWSNALSFQNGFIEDTELTEDDKTALIFAKLQKAVQKSITRAIKEQKGAVGGAKSKSSFSAASTSSPSFIDVCRVLEYLGTTSSMELRDAILGCTLNEMKLVKETSSWWMPKTDYRGMLVQPLLGFVGATCMLSIKYAISPEKWIASEELPSLHHLDPSIATPLFAINVAEEGWLPNASFPLIAPLLYELGIAGGPVTVVLSTGCVQYTPDHPLIRPGGEPHATAFPYSVHRGMNLVTDINLSRCMAHRVSFLANIVGGKRAFRRLEPVVMTIHQEDVSTSEAVIRFSIPVQDLSFGITGLNISSLDFECRWTEEGKFGPMAFTSHDATWTLNEETNAAVVIGQVNTNVPTIALSVRCPGGRMQEPEGLPNTFLVNVALSAEVLVVNDGFATSHVAVSGDIQSPALSTTFPATLIMTTANASSTGFFVQLMGSSFGDAASLCSLVTGVQLPSEPWMAAKLLTITCTLKVDPPSRQATGKGSAVFSGQSGPANITATPVGLHVACELICARVGAINMQGNPDTGGALTLDANAPAAKMPTIRIDGRSSLLTSTPAPCQLELSRAGTVCYVQGEFFEALMQHESFFPIRSMCRVTIPVSLFEAPIRRKLLNNPTISALAAASVPFTFQLQAIQVDKCSIDKQTMAISFNGVLQGSGCEVTVTSCAPANDPSVVDAVAEDAATMMLEQCSEALWSAYDKFVGMRERANRTAVGSLAATGTDFAFGDPAESGAFDSTALTCRIGTFMSQWSDQELQDIEAVVTAAVDPV